MHKYLFITTNEGQNWGGSEPLWISAAEKLANRGNDVCVSVPQSAKELQQVKHLESSGCRVFTRDDRPVSFLIRQIRKLFAAPEYHQKHLRAVANGVGLVVISQGSNWEGFRWMEAARAIGWKYVAISQAVMSYWWPDDDLAERLARSYENASGAYFVSQANMDLTRRQFGCQLRNGRVVRNPFNVRYDARPLWPAGLSEGLSLACVARLDAGHKGHDLLLEVLTLPRWRERKVGLSLVGNGKNERVLRHIVAELRLTNVEFAGHRNDIEGVWEKHHALVLASRYEGLPVSVVEAMLCGRPCIVTDVAGNRELVRDGVNGFLAKGPTVELLDEAMNRAWENRSRLKEMGEIAAIDVRKFVSPDPAEDFVRDLEAVVAQG